MELTREKEEKHSDLRWTRFLAISKEVWVHWVEYWAAKSIMQRNIRPNTFYLCIVKSKSLHRERSASVHTPPNPALTNGRIQGSSGGRWNFINLWGRQNRSKGLTRRATGGSKKINNKRGVKVLCNGFSLLAYLRCWKSFNKWGFSAMFWRCMSSHEDIVIRESIAGGLEERMRSRHASPKEQTAGCYKVAVNGEIRMHPQISFRPTPRPWRSAEPRSTECRDGRSERISRVLRVGAWLIFELHFKACCTHFKLSRKQKIEQKDWDNWNTE